MALPTASGCICHTPRPTDGILAPVLRTKGSAIFGHGSPSRIGEESREGLPKRFDGGGWDWGLAAWVRQQVDCSSSYYIWQAHGSSALREHALAHPKAPVKWHLCRSSLQPAGSGCHDSVTNASRLDAGEPSREQSNRVRDDCLRGRESIRRIRIRFLVEQLLGFCTGDSS
nr:unnamed protein product [Digitaria exilis]